MAYIVPDNIHSPLYVITPIINQIRYKSRWKHYERFAKYVKASGGILVTVEAAFGERHHALEEGVTQYNTIIHGEAPTKPTEFHKARSTHNHIYHMVRTDDEIWYKENLINLGISCLPKDWKYVAWVDADVKFARDNWVGETIHQLQHYQLVQMFSESYDLGPRYATINPAKSFMSCYVNQIERPKVPFQGHYYGGVKMGQGPILWHPGYAWAARREAIDKLGGLPDFAIMGAADNHMAHALIGLVKESFHPNVHPNYRKKLIEWEFRAEKYIRRNVGYMTGTLLHYWHGRKVDRRYWDRWKVIVDNQFDPDADLKYDWQGLLQLEDRGEMRSIQLRDAARSYFRSRNEDSIDLEGVGDFT